ncbi:MAG: hypothetical protein JGK29_05290 [Microcoleus sp. PH2017_17_BER_D_A]|nr:hypothetical protein [Microcoleus sp. PH2017_17_BER_D_A]
MNVMVGIWNNDRCVDCIIGAIKLDGCDRGDRAFPDRCDWKYNKVKSYKREQWQHAIAFMKPLSLPFRRKIG